MKRNILTSLILITAVLTSTVKAYGTVEVRQRLLTSAEPAVSIQKTGENSEGEINPTTGSHGGLSASFNLRTNSDDSGYDYIISSTTPTTTPTSAFADIGGVKAIVFVNVSNETTYQDIERAKMGNVLNRNCIAYPISMNINNPMTVEYVPNTVQYGNCWQVRVNNGTEGTLTQTIGGTPIAGTFNVGHDSSGSYQAIVTFTAVAK